MGAPGRKPKPAHIRLVTGDPHKERINKDEPKPSSKKPCAPSQLSKRGKQIFNLMTRRLDEIGLASSSHTEALCLLAYRLEEVETYKRIIADGQKLLDENGKVVATGSPFYVTVDDRGNDILKPHPVVSLLKDSMRHAQSLLAEFGLTPSAATRVKVPEKEKVGNAFSRLDD